MTREIGRTVYSAQTGEAKVIARITPVGAVAFTDDPKTLIFAGSALWFCDTPGEAATLALQQCNRYEEQAAQWRKARGYLIRLETELIGKASS